MATPDLGWIPAGELAALIRTKKVSPVEVVDARRRATPRWPPRSR